MNLTEELTDVERGRHVYDTLALALKRRKPNTYPGWHLQTRIRPEAFDVLLTFLADETCMDYRAQSYFVQMREEDIVRTLCLEMGDWMVYLSDDGLDESILLTPLGQTARTLLTDTSKSDSLRPPIRRSELEWGSDE